MRVPGLVLAGFLALLSVAHELDTPGLEDVEPITKCSDVRFAPKEDKCTFVKEHCDPEEYNVGVIDHLSVHYCWSDRWRPIGTIVTGMVLGMLFLGLGLTASDYLCPNLYSISKLLNMSDNLAGLTLLALGNSAPDVLSTYQAMSLGSGSLALSELLGAAFFINSVIIGSVVVISPLEVKRNLFIRDSTMFLLVALVMFAIVFSSSITIVHCVLLLSLYVGYVVVVILSHSVVRKRVRKHLEQVRSRSRFSRGMFDDQQQIQGIDQVYLDEFVNLPTIDSVVVVNPPEGDVPGEDNEEDYELEDEEEQELNEVLNSDNNNLRRPLLPKTRSSETSSHGTIHLGTNESLEANLGYDINGYDDEDEDYDEPLVVYNERRQFPFLKFNKLHMRLLLPETSGFTDLDLLSKVLFVAAYPISVFLRLSTPSRDYTVTEFLKQQYQKNRRMSEFESSAVFELDDLPDFDFAFDRKLLTIQTFFGTASAYSLVIGMQTFKWYVCYPLVWALSALAACAVLFNYLTTLNDHRAIFKLIWINKACTGLGFLVSVSWISTFATEVIAVLKTISVVYNLSDELLGVTVFALGNSIGDLVSNLTIAKSGSPLMAFGACFGGPLISMCSLGVSALVILSSYGESVYKVHVSPSLLLFCGFLVLNACITIGGVLLNNWKLDRRLGAVLILNWVLASAICVIRETS